MTNAFDLTGKTAIVTGGNGGIGRAIATGLAEAGVDIAICARNEEKTAKTVREIKEMGRRCIGIRCDVTSQDDISGAIEKTCREFGRIDILVNNAGRGAFSSPESMTEEQWDVVQNTNLKAGFMFARAMYPVFSKAGSGKIINIGSMMSIFGDGLSATYAVSKGGLIQLTKSLAISWAPNNIQVNAICPGWFITDLSAGFKEDKELYQKIVSRTPAQRFGELEELAGAAIFLASSASNFVTGQSIVVDGGFSINPF